MNGNDNFLLSKHIQDCKKTTIKCQSLRFYKRNAIRQTIFIIAAITISGPPIC